MAFSLALFRRGRADDPADLATVRRLLACNVNENLALRAQLALAVEIVDGLRAEVDAMARAAREREAFVAQISRYIEASVPPLYDDGSDL